LLGPFTFTQRPFTASWRGRRPYAGFLFRSAAQAKQAGCERLYVEKASGAHRDRPELKAALEYMRPGDTLVVWRLSRLARSLKQIIETAHDLEQKKQALRVLTRNIDTGTPEGRLSFHITAVFDEFQRELIVENTRAGLAAAKRRGRRGGRPPVLDKDKIRAAEAMLKDTVNYPFVGDVIDHLRIGRTAFYRYFRRIASGSYGSNPERPHRAVSLYVPLSKRTRYAENNLINVRTWCGHCSLCLRRISLIFSARGAEHAGLYP
jgi:DNA invertase Pin-like site-specific DNA recombinase